MGKGKNGPSLTTRSKSVRQTGKGGTGTTTPSGSKPSSLDRKKGKKKKGIITPIWIKYYTHRSRDSGSHVHKGWSLPVSRFEEFMDQFAGDEDALYEILKQIPEVGSFIFADGSGRMRIVHHLSPVIHGKSLIVGLEGFGGTSGEVKVVNCEVLVEEIELESKVGGLEVPPLLDFVKMDLKDVESPKAGSKVDVKEVTTLAQVLDGQPKSYFLHPKWLPLVHQFAHEEPSLIVDAIVNHARQELNQGEDYEGEDLLDRLDECYAFLIYLWACQKLWINVDRSPITYTLESSNFETIQNSILEKTLRLNLSPTEPKNPFVHETTGDAPAPSFGLPPPIGRSTNANARDRPSSEATEHSSDKEDWHQPKRPRREEPFDRPERRTSPKTDRRRHGRPKSTSRGRSRSRSNSEDGGRSNRAWDRRKERSASRPRNRRDRDRDHSRSPPRSGRRASDYYRKRKTLGDKLTDEQMRAFVLLSARDWEDDHPELGRKMELILDQTNLTSAVAMFRSEIEHGDWKGTLPDSAITQFLQDGIVAPHGDVSPAGFSMFFVHPRTYDSRERGSEQMRKERLAQDFGKDGITDETITRLAKLDYYIPRTYEDLKVMIDTGIRWLDFCTYRKSIASDGLRLAADYLVDYRAQFHKIIARDPEFPIKLIHSLDRAVSFVGDKLAYEYRSIRRGRGRLRDVMEKRVDQNLSGIEEGYHSFHHHALPDDILRALKEGPKTEEGSIDKRRGKSRTESPAPVPSPPWFSENSHAIERWCVPIGKNFQDFFGRGSKHLDGWPKFPHHRTNKQVSMCVKYQSLKKCNKKCGMAHILPTQMSQGEFDECDAKFKSIYG